MDPARWKEIKAAYSEALQLPPEERTAHLANLAPEIRLEVERIIAADRDAGEFIENPFLLEQGAVVPSDDEDASHRTIDDYRLIKKVGSGGMGTVYLAEQVGEGFSHQVALKLIKRGMDTDVILKSFLMERQILATLDHPNIARMLDGGSTPDGLPYFVMEYVQGEPLRGYCDSRDLDSRSRVELFAKVCETVSYAHQKLVVHRDLKPSNILVTEKGEPKLLDFGIAKVLAPDWQSGAETVTATQFRILTPEYASPEQLSGEPTTTLTDVYSLGVALYELLTGIRPFQKESRNPAALAEAIRTKQPPKPSVAALFDQSEAPNDPKATGPDEVVRTGDLNDQQRTRRSVPDPRTLRGDLDNIVLKAIRREPESRYQSVRDLLEDIERYLLGLPVKATGDTISYRFKKFVKRHRAGVTVAAVSASLLTGALGFSAYQYSEASRERIRAEARFNEVRRFANFILFDHYELIRNLPGSTEAKAKLVSEAVSYLDAIAEDSGDDPDLLRELAKGYRQLAEIQGITVGSGDLGDLEAARNSLGKALAIREKILAVAPENIEDRRQFAFLSAEFGTISELSVEEKATYGQRAFEIFQELRSRNPNKEQAESDYARGLWDLANARRRLGDNAGAIAHFFEATAIYETLYNNGAGNKRFRRSAALTYKNLGSVQRVSGDAAAALASYEKALMHDTAIAAESPDSIESRLALSFSHRGLGEAHNALEEYQDARRSIAEAIRIQEAITAADPSNAFAADNLFESYFAMAIAYRGIGNPHDSARFFGKAFEIEAKLKRDNADDLRRLSVATAHLEYARLLSTMKGRASAAQVELASALAVFEEIKASGALDPAFAADYERALALKASL